MGLLDDYTNKVQYDEENKDYFEASVTIRGEISDDRYNEMESELSELLRKYNVEFSIN